MPNYLKVAKSLAAEIDATGNLTSYLTDHGPTAGTHRVDIPLMLTPLRQSKVTPLS